MAVQRSVNWISEQMVQLPDMRMIESAVRNDFDQLIQALVTGTSQGYIIRGFNILMANAIGGAASNLQLQVDPGAVMHILASQSGTVLMVPPGTSTQQLNQATNSNVIGGFSPNSINYVTIDYIRFLDDTTDAQVYIWNPTSQTTTTLNAPRANILTYVINISTVTPTSNQLPIAAVLTDSGNNVLSVSDERWLFCRLGTGGTNPNPFYVYPWPEGRAENPFTSTSNSVDPFSGGDKSLLDLKDWMNAVMSVLLEIKGTPYWYSATNSDSLYYLREDLGNTIITGAGTISQGILPNATPILVTTGNVTIGSNSLTVASTAGLADGNFIFLSGLPPATTILNIAGSVITMSEDSTINGTGITVTFYDPSVITAPGQINWDQPIYIDVVGSSLSYELLANPSSNYITLANDQVAYITLVRGQPITPNLIFTNGSDVVTSVGAVAWTSNLIAGDFIKLVTDTDAGYYEILSVVSLTEVTLVNNFGETSTGASGAQAQYAFGSYSAVATPSTTRNIYIANRDAVPITANTFWLFVREDNGGNPKVYIKFLGLALDDGDTQQIGGDVPVQLLQYIGSPSLIASEPNYTAAIAPGSLVQITSITTGAGSVMTSGQYFYIYSSATARTYAVWVSVNGGGSQPSAPYANAYLEWSVLSTDTSTQTATKLAVLLSSTANRDFSAVSSSNVVTVTNNSAGATQSATNFNVSGLSISISQAGTGPGNFVVQDGDNLTLAIKELDQTIGSIEATILEPNYEQTVTIVASGATPPTSLNGPVSAFTNITLPNNSRASSVAQYYVVNSAKLQVFLNGQELIVGDDYTEVGAPGTLSNQIQMQYALVVGDILEFLITQGGGGGLGGPEGPAGPVGPTGPAGSNAVGGPISISTKTSNYTVLSTDNTLLANCTSTAISFFLPPASSSIGRVYWFKKIDSSLNAMIITPNGADLIDGASSLTTIIQNKSYIFQTDGVSWWVF
jgi:hypothetical protein